MFSTLTTANTRSSLRGHAHQAYKQCRFKSTTSAPESAKLSWPDFLAIRRSRRQWQTVATIPACFLGFAGGVAYFANLDTDPNKPIMGIDPFFFYGFATVGSAGLGYILGPSIGSALWRLTSKHDMKLFDQRDRDFYHRIAKRRVDASLQSPTTPVPDYYCEKVGTLPQYRQWLRDQAKYRRKATLPEQ